MKMFVLYFSANFLPLKQQLQKDQALFKQRVDDIQLRITSPTLTDKDTNYGTKYYIFTYLFTLRRNLDS